jgi:hypothetical protein
MGTIVESFVGIWSAIMSFFVDLFPDISALFYTPDTGLTFVGVLAVVSAGVGLIALIFGWVRSFLSMGR